MSKSIEKIPELLEEIKQKLVHNESERKPFTLGKGLLIGIGNGSIDLSQIKHSESLLNNTHLNESVKDLLQNSNEKLGEIYKGIHFNSLLNHSYKNRLCIWSC